MRDKKFVAYYYFIDWSHFLNIGLHISMEGHIEIHVPFGFLRVGWTDGMAHAPNNKTIGYKPSWDY